MFQLTKLLKEVFTFFLKIVIIAFVFAYRPEAFVCQTVLILLSIQKQKF